MKILGPTERGPWPGKNARKELHRLNRCGRARCRPTNICAAASAAGHCNSKCIFYFRVTCKFCYHHSGVIRRASDTPQCAGESTMCIELTALKSTQLLLWRCSYCNQKGCAGRGEGEREAPADIWGQSAAKNRESRLPFIFWARLCGRVERAGCFSLWPNLTLATSGDSENCAAECGLMNGQGISLNL